MTASCSELYARAKNLAHACKFGWSDVILLIFFAELAFGTYALWRLVSDIERLLHRSNLGITMLAVVMLCAILSGVILLARAWRSEWKRSKKKRFHNEGK